MTYNPSKSHEHLLGNADVILEGEVADHVFAQRVDVDTRGIRGECVKDLKMVLASLGN